MASQPFQNGFHPPDGHKNRVTVVLGAQWGDEGKGKLVDLIAQDMDIVARCQGGNNAGHTVVVGEKTYDFHLLPSGIIHPNSVAVVGNGVVIHLPGLFDEIKHNDVQDWEKRLILSNRAQLVCDFHQIVDGLQETERADKKLGTTKKGIGPAYSSKHWRSGIRLGDLMGDFAIFERKYLALLNSYRNQFKGLEFNPETELAQFKQYATLLKKLGIVKDTVDYLHKALKANEKKILIEGANGALLDIDFGTYPYVTSSNCTVGGVCTGLGLPPNVIGDVIGIVKAYQTRVGDGPFPSEQENDVGKKLRDIGGEYGVTTGRPRRCGWLDLFLLKYSSLINGFSSVCLTKLDVLDSLETIKVVVGYKLGDQELDTVPSTIGDFEKVEPVYRDFPGWNSSTAAARKFGDLPENAQKYVSFIEEFTGVNVKWIGVGKERAAIIVK